MEEKRLSRYIDDPPYFLFWPLPEAIPLLTCIIGGLYFSQVGLFLLLGLSLTYLIRKLNSRQKAGYLLHVIYSWGLLPTKARTMVNPYCTFFTK